MVNFFQRFYRGLHSFPWKQKSDMNFKSGKEEKWSGQELLTCMLAGSVKATMAGGASRVIIGPS